LKAGETGAPQATFVMSQTFQWDPLCSLETEHVQSYIKYFIHKKPCTLYPFPIPSVSILAWKSGRKYLSDGKSMLQLLPKSGGVSFTIETLPRVHAALKAKEKRRP